MATLQRITIKGYRSIKDASLELRNLNVLIGANGAGKSNFVSFFKMLNEMMAGRLQEYIGTTGWAKSLLHFGPKVTAYLEAELEFEADAERDKYFMRLFHAEADDTLGFAVESLQRTYPGPNNSDSVSYKTKSGHKESFIGEEANQGMSAAKVFRRLLNQCRVYHFHDTSPKARIRSSCYVEDNRWLMPDASNLAAMLFAYRNENEVVYKRIVSTVRKIMPEFDDFDLVPSRLNPNDIFLNWRRRGSDYLFGPHQISDGTLRAMSIVTLFLQPESDLPDVIILDEPELGLHPHALELVAGLMRAASETTQVIVATQSLTFLNFFEPAEIVTVECLKGQTSLDRLDPASLEDWLADYSIGELWQRNVIGGGPLP